MVRRAFVLISLGLTFFITALSFLNIYFLLLFLLIGPLIILGAYDMLQTKRSVLRNFPIIGHGRFLMEAIRPELQQYFVESNISGRPINREHRSIVYQRAKGDLQTLPFGTQRDVYAPGYEWVNHSLHPVSVPEEALRVRIGNKQCTQPYLASIFNISAISYGSISKNAVLALNGGAKIGGFSHNTGEGGLSPYHLEMGGDIVWQIGTAYFGCRTSEGFFCEKTFLEKVKNPAIKMLEIKLSQGAKPSHGGILPAQKVTPEIAQIRGVPLGQDILSPPVHSAFKDTRGLVGFIQHLRTLSGGKPVGFKICIGIPEEFLEIVTEMKKLNIYPDFITVDGGEGGTGAAPLEFSNSVGTPLAEGLSFVHNTLVQQGIRDEIKLIAAGKIMTGFQILRAMALGADVTNSARGMMLALGCIQALRCNSNHCPVGIATNDPGLMVGLNVTDKKQRVAHFQKETVKAFQEILGAMGLDHPQKIKRSHILRRVSSIKIMTYEEIYPLLCKES